MKVLLLNGSRREKGCTYTALSEIAQTLEKQGIQAEIIHAVPETEIIKSVAEKVKTVAPNDNHPCVEAPSYRMADWWEQRPMC